MTIEEAKANLRLAALAMALRSAEYSARANYVKAVDDLIDAAKEERAEETHLQMIYDSDPEVKDEADKLHRSRMMTGPACLQCIAIAEARIKKKETWKRLGTQT